MAMAAAADIITSMADGSADTAGALGLLPLFAWLSPAFPVGGYAYSHALEWAVEAGDVRDEESLAAWLSDLLVLGFARSDAILLSLAFDAAEAGDTQRLAEVNALAVALAPSAELRLETCQQGRSFLDAVAASWPHPALARLAPAFAGEVAYPVAVGTAAAVHGLPKPEVVPAFLQALMQALVSAALRLAPIGQTTGMRVLAALAPAIMALAAEIPGLGEDDLGTATFRADLGSFRHETQYTRLFRS
jgi:urease accessory protein